MQVTMEKYTKEDLEYLAELLKQMRLEIAKGTENVQNVFQAEPIARYTYFKEIGLKAIE